MYIRRNLQLSDTKAQAQFYAVGEAIFQAPVADSAQMSWWIAVDMRRIKTAKDSSECRLLVRDALSAHARLLMQSTCDAGTRLPTLAASDSLRLGSALLATQRAQLAAVLLSPDGKHVFGARELTADGRALRAVLTDTEVIYTGQQARLSASSAESGYRP